MPARHQLLLLCSYGLLAPAAGAQVAAGPRSSAQTLAPRIDSIFAEFDRRDSPGCAVAVIRAGAILFEKGYGAANLEWGEPIQPNTVFQIASTSKQFTAMAIAILMRDGRLSAATDLRQYFPELAGIPRSLPLHDVIAHTSGIRDYLDLMDLAGWRPYETPISNADVLSIMSRQRALNFAPGTQFRYENTSYVLLAELVMRVTGESLKAFAARLMFEPLGMTNTHFQNDHTDIVAHRAEGYVRTQHGFRRATLVYDEYGDGGVFTTVEDLAKWDANFYTAAVGGRFVIDRLVAPGHLNNGTPLDYAFGLFVGQYRGHATVDHGGDDPGYQADFLRFPADSLAVAVLCNLEGAGHQLVRKVADVFLAAPGSTSITLSRTQPKGQLGARDSARAGRYLSDDTGQILDFTIADGELAIRGARGTRPLYAVTGTVLIEQADTTNQYEFVAVEGRSGVKQRRRGAAPLLFLRLENVKTVTPADLARFAGEYQSKELDACWHLEIRRDTLTLTIPRGTTAVLTPLTTNAFTSDVGLLRFSRVKGAPMGFTVSNVRDHGIQFVHRKCG